MSHFVVTVLVKTPPGYDHSAHKAPSSHGEYEALMAASAEVALAVGGKNAPLATFFERSKEAKQRQQEILEARPDLVKEIEAEAKRLLEPFSENLEVPEYDTPCHCVGMAAKAEARKHADETIGAIQSLRESFAAVLPFPDVSFARTEADVQMSEANDEAWTKHLAPYNDAERSFFDAHPMKDKADPICGFYMGERQSYWPEGVKEGDRYEDGSGCGGTGTYRSTHNPKSKWDWFSIGGRWDGNVPGNIAPVETVLTMPKFSCRAVVTPDGQWIECGRMGWFGMSSGDKPKEEWAIELRSLLEANRDCLAVNIDCHI